MDVDNAIGVGADHRGVENRLVARERDDLDACLAQRRDDGFACLGPRSILFGHYHARRHVMLARDLKRWRIAAARDDEADGCRQIAPLDGAENRGEVAATTGDQHADARKLSWSAHVRPSTRTRGSSSRRSRTLPT